MFTSHWAYPLQKKYILYIAIGDVAERQQFDKVEVQLAADG